MLERIGELGRNLVVLIFVAVLLEMLIPRGTFSRYLRLVIGLLVILLVVTFIGSLLNRLPEEGSPVLPAFATGAEGEVAAQGRDLWELNRQETLALYRAQVAAVIREEIGAQNGGFPVFIGLLLEEDETGPRYGMIEGVTVKISSAPAEPPPAGEIYIEPIQIRPAHPAPEEEARRRVPELESALARRLQLAPGIIEVWEVN